MTWRDRRVVSRGVLVLLWLLLAVGFLWFRQPGFWRSPYLRYQQARALASINRTPDAIDEMGRAIAEDPRNLGYLTYKGYLELHEARLEAAARTFQSALVIRTDDIEASLGLAEAFARLGDPVKTDEALRHIRFRGMRLEDRFRRRAIYAMVGRFDRALDDQPMVEAIRDPARLRQVLAWAMSATRWETAIDLADRVTAATTDPALKAEAIGQKAIALRALGRLDQSLEQFESVATNDNLVIRAQIALQLEMYPRAARLYAFARRQHPHDAAILERLVYAETKAGDWRAAVDAARSQLAAADTVEHRVTLTRLLNAARDYSQAWTVIALANPQATDLATRELQAQTALWSNNLGTAEALLTGLPRATAASTAAEEDLAYRFEKVGQDADAERVYRRVADSGRAQRATWLRLTHFLNTQQRYAEAWRVAQRIPAVLVDDEIEALRAQTAFWARDYHAAAPLLSAWIARHPDAARTIKDAAEAARQTGDAASEVRMLTAYVQLRPDDAVALERLAGMHESAGRVDAAIDAYQSVLDWQPTRAGIARTLAYLQARAGRPHDAIITYRRAWELAEPKDREIALVVARLYQQQGMLDAAIEWYERALPLLVARQQSTVRAEMAQVQFDAGRGAAALASIEQVVGDGAAGEAALVLGARAATAVDRPALAAAYLERLAVVRPLRLEEQRWLGGQYASAADTTSALRIYHAMLAQVPDDAGALEAIGDLFVSAGDLTGALPAFEHAHRLRPAPPLRLKIARLLTALGDYPRAAASYHVYLSTGEVRGVRLEAARVFLAASDPDTAERWARSAAASTDEHGVFADLVLAQALQLSGKVKESVDVLRPGVAPATSDPNVIELLGQLAAARNEHLRSTRLFSAALQLGAANPERLWYEQSLSALKRGDFARASATLRRANLTGAREQEARLAISRATAPLVTGPLRVFGDANGLSLAQGGVAGQVWLKKAFALHGELLSGTLAQSGTRYDRTTGTLRLSRTLVDPALTVDLLSGFEQSGQRPGRLTGRAALAYSPNDASTFGAEIHRETIWSSLEQPDLRQFNRGVDLSALGPDFLLRGWRAFVSHNLLTRQNLRIESGRDAYQDANARTFSYGHYQFVAADHDGWWVALRPNAYWETYTRPSSRYFSPSRYVSIGSALHAIRTTPTWRVEAELNPMLSRSGTQTAFLLQSAVDVRRQVGPFSTGGGAFLFYDDRNRYWSWRVTAQLGIRVGP